MKTVGEFKAAGVEFVEGDEGNGFYVRNAVLSNNHEVFDYDEVTSFEWRDLSTKPDNPQYKIELDIDNHRWRPSLNQGVEYPYEQRVNTAQAKPPEFKAGDLVEVEHTATGKYLVKIKYIDMVSLFGYLQSDNNQSPRMDQFCAYMKDITIKPYNPELNALKDIIGTHEDPTECAKAILAAGYKK